MAEELRVNFTGNTRSLDKSAKDATRSLDKFDRSVSNIGKSIASIFAGRALANFAKDSFLLAARAEGVEKAFNRLNNIDLEGLQKATRNTVDSVRLMQAAVQARNFKIPLEELGGFFQFATKRANETGESVDFLVNSIVTGLGRKSPLILDNLGISAVELRKKLKGVGIQSASTADVAKALNEVIQEQEKAFGATGQEAFTAGQKVEKLTAQWRDFKVEFGESLTGGGQSGLDNLANNLQVYTRLLKVFNDDLVENGEVWKAVLKGGVAEAEKLNRAAQLEKDQKALEEQAKIDEAINKIIAAGTKEIFLQNTAKEKGNFVAKVRVEILKREREEQEKQNKAAEAYTTLTEDQQKAVDKLNQSLKIITASQGVLGTQFTHTEDRISAYQKAIVSLKALGIDPAHETLKAFNAALREQQAILSGQEVEPLDIGQLGSPEQSAAAAENYIKIANAVQSMQFPLEQFNKLSTEAASKAAQFKEISEAVGFTWQNIGIQFSQTFTGMLEQGTVTIKGLVSNLIKLIAKLAVAAAAAAALRSILGDPTAGTRGAQAAIAISGVIGGLAAAAVPFAKGGVVTGPTFGLIGEGRHDEAVLPLPALDRMLSSMRSSGMQEAAASLSSGGIASSAIVGPGISGTTGRPDITSPMVGGGRQSIDVNVVGEIRNDRIYISNQRGGPQRNYRRGTRG